MIKLIALLGIVSLFLPLSAQAQEGLETDVIETSGGSLKITFIGHASLMFAFGDKIIHVDPVSSAGNYSALPKANLILITHEHKDHLDPKTIETLSTPDTILVATENAAKQVKGAIVMKNGEVQSIQGFKIEAAPAYNLVHMRSEGVPYHPKGNGNGYIVTFGDKRVYIAGDTENTPEMKALQGIDIAFLPMNLPYTMTPEMVADAAKSMKPRILYPYHCGETDTCKIVDLLKGDKEIDVRIRNMK